MKHRKLYEDPSITVINNEIADQKKEQAKRAQTPSLIKINRGQQMIGLQKQRKIIANYNKDPMKSQRFTLYGAATGTYKEESELKPYKYLPNQSPAGGDFNMEPKY